MKLIRDSFFVLGGNMVQIAVSVGSGVLIARTLGPVGKGEIYLVVQFVSLATVLLGLGLGQAYQYHLRKETYDSSVLIAHMLLQIAIVGAVLAGIYALALPALGRLTGHVLSPWLLAFALVLTFLNIATTYFGFAAMAVPEGIKVTSVYTSLGGLIYVASLAVLFFVRPSLPGALVCNALGIVARAAPTVAFVFRHIRPAVPHLTIPLMRHLFGYGIGSLLGNLMMTTVLRIDTFLVNIYLGPASLGIYSVAVAIGEFLLMAPSAVGIALFPYLTSADEQTQMVTVAKVARLTVILSTVGCLGLALIGYPAILLLFGRRFLAAYVPLLVLLPGLIAMSLVYAFANLFSSRGEPIVNFFVFGIATLVNIVANVVLLPRFQVVGASMASTLAYGIIAILFVTLVRARSGIGVLQLLMPKASDFALIVARLRPKPRVGIA